jgi:hypothetical protein
MPVVLGVVFFNLAYGRGKYVRKFGSIPFEGDRKLQNMHLVVVGSMKSKLTK